VEHVAVDGAALVDWLIANAAETAADRAGAVALGQRLIEAGPYSRPLLSST